MRRSNASKASDFLVVRIVCSSRRTTTNTAGRGSAVGPRAWSTFSTAGIARSGDVSSVFEPIIATLIRILVQNIAFNSTQTPVTSRAVGFMATASRETLGLGGTGDPPVVPGNLPGSGPAAGQSKLRGSLPLPPRIADFLNRSTRHPHSFLLAGPMKTSPLIAAWILVAVAVLAPVPTAFAQEANDG